MQGHHPIHNASLLYKSISINAKKFVHTRFKPKVITLSVKFINAPKKADRSELLNLVSRNILGNSVMTP